MELGWQMSCLALANYNEIGAHGEGLIKRTRARMGFQLAELPARNCCPSTRSVRTNGYTSELLKSKKKTTTKNKERHQIQRQKKKAIKKQAKAKAKNSGKKNTTTVGFLLKQRKQTKNTYHALVNAV